MTKSDLEFNVGISKVLRKTIEHNTKWSKKGKWNLTASSIEKPFVHVMRVPDAIDSCLTGNEKVKPSSLCLPGDRWKSSPSVATNFASAEAIKSNNACKSLKCSVHELIF